jgi:hypothetical protein
MECAKAAQCTRCQHQGRHHAQTAQRATTLVRINVSCVQLDPPQYLARRPAHLAAQRHTATLPHLAFAQSVLQAKFLPPSVTAVFPAVLDTTKSMQFVSCVLLVLRRLLQAKHLAPHVLLAVIRTPELLVFVLLAQMDKSLMPLQLVVFHAAPVPSSLAILV